jgi:hypothetical protein
MGSHHILLTLADKAYKSPVGKMLQGANLRDHHARQRMSQKSSRILKQWYQGLPTEGKTTAQRLHRLYQTPQHYALRHPQGIRLLEKSHHWMAEHGEDLMGAWLTDPGFIKTSHAIGKGLQNPMEGVQALFETHGFSTGKLVQGGIKLMKELPIFATRL